MRLANPFELPGEWLKANLHCHTTNSDGDATPAERLEQYAEAGFQVLAITDHGCVTPIAPLARGDILLIQSLEAHPPCPGSSAYHLVCLNVPADFPYDAAEPAQRLIDRVRQAGGETIVAHPYWCGRTVQQILVLENILGVEVYNSTCTKIGKGDSTVIWDYLLDAGRVLPAVAVDDVHRGRDRFLGWTLIKAAERTTEAVMAALRQGAFYATCGPTIQDCRMVGGVLRLACSPAREIHFCCQQSRGLSIYQDEGEPLTAAEFAVPEQARYVRTMVVDSAGRRAWTQPFAQ